MEHADIKQDYPEIAETHLQKILAWALRKTGDSYLAEDLAQDVFTQFYTAAAKAGTVEKPEHLLWKVAHFCWCNHLRRKTKESCQTALDENIPLPTDFVTEMVSNEEISDQIQMMRHQISNLSHMQREAMILHYLEEYSLSQVAEKMGTTVTAVTWHLFDARKKVKKELEHMCMPEPTYVYRPGRMNVGLSGYPGPDPDTKRLQDSLIRQNLCLLCRSQGRSLDELAQQTGIPKPYLEYDLDWLLKRDFMTMQGKKYSTAFPIITRQHMQDIAALYVQTRPELIDRVIDTLWSQEEDIRAIGFYGCDFPTQRLMWAVLTMFISYVSRNSPLLTRLKSMDNRPIRPDGGQYVVMAGEQTPDRTAVSNDNSEEILWGGYYGICSDSCLPGNSEGSRTETYYWLGVNCFADASCHPTIVHAEESKRSLLHWLYTSVTEPWFSEDKLEPHGRQALAEAVADGLIAKDGSRYIPNFVIFSPEQLCRLQEEIYRPLMETLEPVFSKLADRIASMHKVSFPPCTKCDVDYHTYVDLWNFGIYAMMAAARDGKLWMPEKPEQGTPLTLVIVR